MSHVEFTRGVAGGRILTAKGFRWLNPPIPTDNSCYLKDTLSSGK